MTPKPTCKLSAEAMAWWRKLTEEFEIDDQAGLLLLETALAAMDRMREAQRLITKDGAVVRDRFGQLRQHPAHAIERDSRVGMIAALRQLNLDAGTVAQRIDSAGRRK